MYTNCNLKEKKKKKIMEIIFIIFKKKLYLIFDQFNWIPIKNHQWRVFTRQKKNIELTTDKPLMFEYNRYSTGKKKKTQQVTLFNRSKISNKFYLMHISFFPTSVQLLNVVNLLQIFFYLIVQNVQLLSISLQV